MTDRCYRGHELTDENTYTYPDGRRACRECDRILRDTDERRERNREARRRYMEKNRDAVNARRRERRAAKRKEATG